MRRMEWRSWAVTLTSAPLEGAARPPHDLVLLVLDPEQRRQDTAGVGRRRLGAKAAGLVRDRHHVLRVGARCEHHIPGLIGTAETLLGCARLAAHLHREALEHVDRGAPRVVRG